MKFPRFARFVLPLFLFLVSTASAQPSAPTETLPIENSRQARRSWVSDGADVLSVAEEKRINAVCAELEKRTGAELEIVTVRSLGGKDVREFSVDLARALGVGKKGKNNGVVMLGVFDPTVPAGQRKYHIEVGYGLEGELPDGKATAIMRDLTIPEWKRGNYGEGFYQGAVAVAQAIEPAFVAPASGSQSLPVSRNPDNGRDTPGNFGNYDPGYSSYPSRAPAGGAIFGLLGLLALLFPILFIGGIVWFFTAAMRRPLRCSKCRAPVQQLSDTAELPSLSPVQRFEQQIGARDYRVWRCAACHNEDITAHDLPYSQWVQCPTCRHQTASTLVETLREPTPWQGGMQRVILSCQWEGCKHSNFYNRPTAPMPRGGYHRGYGGGGGDLLTGVVLGSLLNGGGGWGSSGGYSGGGGNNSRADSGGGFDSGGFDSGPSDFGGGDFGGGGGGGDW